MLPIAAAFLAWLHIGELGARAPGVRLLGTAWLGALAIAGAGLAVHDARLETATVRGAAWGAGRAAGRRAGAPARARPRRRPLAPG